MRIPDYPTLLLPRLKFLVDGKGLTGNTIHVDGVENLTG
jgi:hypothetical protein